MKLDLWKLIFFHIKPQLAISCILIRINGAINEKMVSISAKLTVKRLDITLLLESYQKRKKKKKKKQG